VTDATITIQLDAEAARIYSAASEAEQKKLQLLLSLWLRELAASPTPLDGLMDQISDKAQARGLTPEVLESILYDR
jgi:hypothetical protein